MDKTGGMQTIAIFLNRTGVSREPLTVLAIFNRFCGTAADAFAAENTAVGGIKLLRVDGHRKAAGNGGPCKMRLLRSFSYPDNGRVAFQQHK